MAEPGESLLPCDRELWKHGERIATIIDLEPSEIERIVKSAAELSGQRMDWHYVRGRACVRALGDLSLARNYLLENLKLYSGKYSFAKENDSILP